MNFDKATHTYSFRGEGYTSVSEYLLQFKPEFPKERIATAMAKRDKRDKDEIIDEWETKSSIASDYGNAVHNTIKLWVRYKQEPNAPHLKEVLEKFKKLKLGTLYSEVIVYCPELLIAGTVDLFQKVGKQVNILDIKTSNDTSKERGYFLKPLDHIPFSKENEHKLQVGMYKELSERRGVKIKDTYILYYDGEFKKVKIQTIKIIKQ